MVWVEAPMPHIWWPTTLRGLVCGIYTLPNLVLCKTRKLRSIRSHSFEAPSGLLHLLWQGLAKNFLHNIIKRMGGEEAVRALDFQASYT